MPSRFPALVILLLGLLCGAALSSSSALAATAPKTREETLKLSVDGQPRTALVERPENPSPEAPLILVFHGHGGSSANARKTFRLEKLWPEAIVVYPQGLPTAGVLTDHQGTKPGWQATIGSEGDRDLRFFLELLKHFEAPAKRRVFVTGHSNGGAFCYQLLAAYPELLSGLAPSAAVYVRGVTQLTPKPIYHMAGMHDPLVKPEWQIEMVARVRVLNHATNPGTSIDKDTQYFKGQDGNDVQYTLHTGGHEVPSNGPANIVRFFKDLNARPSGVATVPPPAAKVSP